MRLSQRAIISTPASDMNGLRHFAGMGVGQRLLDFGAEIAELACCPDPYRPCPSSSWQLLEAGRSR